jgi:hypothetical protein
MLLPCDCHMIDGRVHLHKRGPRGPTRSAFSRILSLWPDKERKRIFSKIKYLNREEDRRRQQISLTCVNQHKSFAFLQKSCPLVTAQVHFCSKKGGVFKSRPLSFVFQECLMKHDLGNPCTPGELFHYPALTDDLRLEVKLNGMLPCISNQQTVNGFNKEKLHS